MPNELYLILHKVRGKPAFDIASRLDSEQRRRLDRPDLWASGLSLSVVAPQPHGHQRYQ